MTTPEMHMHTYYLTPDSWLPDEIMDKLDHDVSRIEATRFSNGDIVSVSLKGPELEADLEIENFTAEVTQLDEGDSIDIEYWIKDNPSSYFEACNLPRGYDCLQGWIPK